jgi:hypothetical protein
MATKSPDLGRDLGKLEGSVDVLKTLTFTVIGFLIAIAGGGIFLLMQIYEVMSTVADIKRDVTGAVEKIGKIEETLGPLEAAGQGSVTGSLARIESALKGQLPPLQPTVVPRLLISVNDAQAIRSALKADPDTTYKNEGKLGDVLTNAKLSDFPKELVEQFPQLKTLRYVFDVKNQILIATADQRVVAIV